jgi:Fe-S-cluster containining protein
MFENDIAKEIQRKWREMLAYRENFSCSGCGGLATCCNLACSEFSPEALGQKAANKDNFATQFLSVFVPYETRAEAEKVYPEYLQLLQNTLEGTTDEDVYFYHCPKLNGEGRCSDYENRPQICRDFPDNPLSILPKSCGFYNWREEVQPVALMLHSMLEILNYYKERILGYNVRR